MLAWSPLVFALAMLVVCTGALLFGAWEEKWLGGAYLAACTASLAVEHRPWEGPQGAVIGIDAIVLCITIAAALRSIKIWPIFAAAFQVLTLGAHLAFILATGRLGAAGYLTVLALWSYGMVVCIAVGVTTHRSRERPRLAMMSKPAGEPNASQLYTSDGA